MSDLLDHSAPLFFFTWNSILCCHKLLISHCPTVPSLSHMSDLLDHRALFFYLEFHPVLSQTTDLSVPHYPFTVTLERLTWSQSPFFTWNSILCCHKLLISHCPTTPSLSHMNDLLDHSAFFLTWNSILCCHNLLISHEWLTWSQCPFSSAAVSSVAPDYRRFPSKCLDHRPLNSAAHRHPDQKTSEDNFMHERMCLIHVSIKTRCFSAGNRKWPKKKYLETTQEDTHTHTHICTPPHPHTHTYTGLILEKEGFTRG